MFWLNSLLFMSMGRNIFDFIRNIRLYQFFHDLFCPFDDGIGNPCKPGHLDTVTFVRAPLYDLAKEDDVVALLLHGDTIVIDVIDLSFQFCQLVIMSGK